MSIPAKDFVSVNPAVLAAGGAALALTGLILTNSTAVPLGTVKPFGDTAAVSAYFGGSSDEAALASIYFAGYDGSGQKPGNLLFSQYNTAAVAAYLRGGALAMTLAQVQAITPGVLTMTVNGVVKATTSIDLSAASSLSNAAALISAGFTGGPVVSYSSQHDAFVFTSGTTGAASTITFGTGAIATALKLTDATGAVLSQGAIAATPAAAMDAITAQTTDWASFMTTFEPLLADKTAFGEWNAQQSYRYAYVCWDTDVNQLDPEDETAFGTLDLGGSIAIYNDRDHAAFTLGAIASVNFGQVNGRVTLAYKGQDGLTPSVTDSTTANTLKAKGINFYGDVATSGDSFKFFYPGRIGGDFAYIDTYINQIYLNSQFQVTLMTLLTNVGSIPYNADGYAQIEQALKDPIDAALSFGSIRPGVTLAGTQKAEVNALAGVAVDQTLSTRGWYLQVKAASPTVRASRGSPPCLFLYMDGGSVQSIDLASIVLQ